MRVDTATPPMGWNSWDCFGTTVTEDEVIANAEFMARHLLPSGWNVVVVDIQWYEPTARAGGYNDNPPILLDDFGRQQPAPNRFPSAARGAGARARAELRAARHARHPPPRSGARPAREGHPVDGAGRRGHELDLRLEP